jgi:hypothetical protein
VIFPTLAIRQIEQIELNPNDRRGLPATFFIEHVSYRIECYDQTFVGKLIEGTFPDYARVIPEGWVAFPNEYGKYAFSPIYIAAIMEAVSFSPEQFEATANPMRMFLSDGNPAVIQETSDPGVVYDIMTTGTSLPEHWHVAPVGVPAVECEVPVTGAEPEPVVEPAIEQAAGPEATAIIPHFIQYRGYSTGSDDLGGSTVSSTAFGADEPLWYNDWKPTPTRKFVAAGRAFVAGAIVVTDHQVTRAEIGKWLAVGKAEVI